MIFLMHLELCYFSIKPTSAFPMWERGEFGSGWSNHRYWEGGGSYPLEYLNKCFKVTLISLSNTNNPNLKVICMGVFKTLPQVFYIIKVKTADFWVASYHCSLTLDIFIYSPAWNKGCSLPNCCLKSWMNSCLHRKNIKSGGSIWV